MISRSKTQLELVEPCWVWRWSELVNQLPAVSNWLESFFSAGWIQNKDIQYLTQVCPLSITLHPLLPRSHRLFSCSPERPVLSLFLSSILVSVVSYPNGPTLFHGPLSPTPPFPGSRSMALAITRFHGVSRTSFIWAVCDRSVAPPRPCPHPLLLPELPHCTEHLEPSRSAAHYRFHGNPLPGLYDVKSYSEVRKYLDCDMVS